MTESFDGPKATLHRLIGDAQDAVSYMKEAWKSPSKQLIIEAAERLDEVADKLWILRHDCGQ